MKGNKSRGKFVAGVIVGMVVFGGLMVMLAPTRAGIAYTGEHFDTAASGNTAPESMTTDGNYIWVGGSGHKVYKYTMDGTYVDSWVAQYSLNPKGLATDGNYIWVSASQDYIYKYTMDGTYVAGYNVGDYGYGLTTDGTYLWNIQTGGIYKYYCSNLTYTGEHWNPGTTYIPFAITTDGNYIWIAVTIDGSVNDYHIRKYTMDGTYTGESWSISQSNIQGLTTTDGIHFWVASYDDAEVYKYAHFTLHGLTNYKMTWGGEPGDDVWGNATGAGYETLNISVNRSIYSTDITDIKVWVGDMSDGTNYINASNISIQFSSDNITWGPNTRSFQDGGSNITINATLWTTANGCYGTNPFPISSDTNIYARLKLHFPGGLPVAVYNNIADWKVYLLG